MEPDAYNESEYKLMMEDGLSVYTSLHTYAKSDSDAATNSLSKWIASFGCMNWLVTIQGSHFVASLMIMLTKESKLNIVSHLHSAVGRMARSKGL